MFYYSGILSINVHFYIANAYTVNPCNRNHLSAGIVRYLDNWTTDEITDRLSIIIASNLNINFKGNVKYNISDWTKNEIEQFNNFTNSDIQCLRNLPHKIFQSPTCGNGFVETGEDCDCGLPSECRNSCCDPLTCRKRPNSLCTAGNCFLF